MGPCTMSLSAGFVSIFLEGECPFCAMKLSPSIVPPTALQDKLENKSSGTSHRNFVYSLQKHVVHLRAHRQQFLKAAGQYSIIVKANTKRVQSAVDFLEQEDDSDQHMNEAELTQGTKTWIKSLRKPLAPRLPLPV